MEKIYIGADHGGFKLKENMKLWLGELGYEIEDFGALTLVFGDDYPDYASLVATQVANDISEGKKSVGILFCRSGGGMVIFANKVKEIRAVSVFDEKSAVLAKKKNDANVISISADWTTENQAQKIILAFLEANFSGEERHIRRINKIKEFENAPLGEGGREQ